MGKENIKKNNIPITNTMHFYVYGVFQSKFSHQHVSATHAVKFRVILLQEYEGTNVVICVVTP